MVRLASFLLFASLAIVGYSAPWSDGVDGTKHVEQHNGLKNDGHFDGQKCRDKFQDVVFWDDKCFGIFDKAKENVAEGPMWDGVVKDFGTSTDGLTSALVLLIEEFTALGESGAEDTTVIVEAFESCQKSIIKFLEVIVVSIKFIPGFKVIIIAWIITIRDHFKQLTAVIIVVIEVTFKERAQKCHEELDLWFDQALKACQ